MKLLTTGFAVLALFSLPAFAQESAVKKQPFYRPHRNSRVNAEKPRALSSAVIVNAASFESGISPGGLATIFGDSLVTVDGVVYADANPLPTDIDGVEVDISGIAAPIYGIYGGSQDQISVQVPYGAPTGPKSAEVQVFNIVSGQSMLIADFFTDSFTEDPGIFTWDGNVSGGAAIYALAEAVDYSLIGPDNPALVGETLQLFVTGLGPLNDPDLVDGYGSPTSPPFAETLDPFQVILDGESCHVDFSGLAPGFVGLYQINFDVPLDAASGNLQLSIQSTYANSLEVTLPVR